MTNQGIDIQHPKLRGEWAELRFMARAAEHGLRISKPFGDCASYDVTVEHCGIFHRVQIKSTTSLRNSTEFQQRRPDSYLCGIDRTSGQAYTKDQVDFLAVYIIPCDVWYIFPVEVLGGAHSLNLSPQLANSKHAPYKEAWRLLSGGPNNQACASTEDSDQPESAEESADDEPMNGVEARLHTIRERLLAHPLLETPPLTGNSVVAGDSPAKRWQIP